MASNYLLTGGNILLSLGTWWGGGGGKKTKNNLDIFFWGGGNRKKMEIQFQIFIRPPSPLVNNERNLRHSKLHVDVTMFNRINTV